MKIHRHWSGEPHRIDGPATIDDNGDSIWYMHGRRHRFGGPAVVYANGNTEWYIYGSYCTKPWHDRVIREMFEPPPDPHDIMVEEFMLTRKVTFDGSIRYLNAEGQSHRLGGPALLRADGAELWYRNNLMHRFGAPAVVYPNREKQWRLNGKLHCINGPAIEYVKGGSGWFIYGIPYDHEDFDLQVQILRDYYRTL